jgi:hypothetical protein
LPDKRQPNGVESDSDDQPCRWILTALRNCGNKG